MLTSNDDGSWNYVRIKNEVARHNCISVGDARELGARSLEIAKNLGRGCHIMWFVGCFDSKGNKYNLPWYWTESHGVEVNQDRLNYKIIEITNEESLGEFIDSTEPRVRRALELKPKISSLVRDSEFVKSVGMAAKIADVPVIVSGSTLAHAYYLLSMAGCTVISRSSKDYSRIRKKTNIGKLVRDNIPMKIESRRETNVSRNVSGDLKKGFLIGKLIEEAMEIRDASNSVQKAEELGDLLEVVKALVEAEGISIEEVEDAARIKKKKAGGFEKGIVLFETGIEISEKDRLGELEKRMDELVIGKRSKDIVDVPFSFFGLTKFEVPRTIHFESIGISVQITLFRDRIEMKILRKPEQVEFSLNEE